MISRSRDFFNQADLLSIGEFRLFRLGGSFSFCISFFTLSMKASIFRWHMTASAAGLSVIGDLFNGLEIVLPDGLYISRSVTPRHLQTISAPSIVPTPIIGNGGFKGFLPHDGAVHLFFGKPPRNSQYPGWLLSVPDPVSSP